MSPSLDSFNVYLSGHETYETQVNNASDELSQKSDPHRINSITPVILTKKATNQLV